MREFKFRAWNKQENEMVDLVTVGSREVDKNRSTWPALYYRKSDGIITGFDHEDYEVLQYTGLKDKNGVEIYEGDIVHLSSYDGIDHNASITFYNGGYCAIDGVEEDHSIRRYGLMRSELNVEIIGNIYENPELMVGDEDGQTR